MSEGTPSTLQTLVRKDGLTKDEWNRILEDLRKRIKPFLDTVTLEAVGDIRLSGANQAPKIRGHRIGDDFNWAGLKLAHGSPQTSTYKGEKILEILNMRGFFFLGDTVESAQQYVRNIWGLNRTGLWVWGCITVDHPRDSFADCHYQKALNIELDFSSPDLIVSQSYKFEGGENANYRRMWIDLLRAFDVIVDERRDKYEKVLQLQRELEKESFLIRYISTEVS